MRKHQLPAWGACLLLIALTLGASRFLWLPITEESGEHTVEVLKNASANSKYITLDFGYVTDYRIPRSEAAELLLAESAFGQSYEVTARYHSSGKNRNRYYEVLALTGTDGTVYRTLEEAEAARQAALPLRLGLLVVLDIAGCALLIWREQQIRRGTVSAKEASE